MKIKITDPSGRSVYAELTEGHFVETIRMATFGINDEGDKQLYFIVSKDSDFSLEIIDHACSAIVKVFSDSLVWDIVTELPEPLRAEDGVAVYLHISQ